MRPLLWLLIVLGGLTTAAMASEVPVDRVQLLDLLRKGDFEALEARLTRLQQDSEAGNGQDQWIGVAFHAFGIVDSEIQARLEEWVNKKPGSYVARVARAAQYRELGWKARGNDYASETSEDQFAGMRRHFAKAREDLYAALKINSELSIAYVDLIDIASTEGRDEERFRALEAGLSVAPRSYHIRWRFLNRLEPEWGGSMEMVEAFAEASVRTFPEDSLLQTLRGYPDWVRGNHLRWRGKHDEALILFDRALQHGPHWRYLISRARVLDLLGRDDEALEAYDQADAVIALLS